MADSPRGLVAESLVVRRRRRRALDELSFAAGRGVLAVLGPNGAGKTTLFQALAGLTTAESGVMLFDGADLRTSRGRRVTRGALGYQPQKPVFNNGFTVEDSVRYASWLKGPTTRETKANVDRALEVTHLTDLASRPVRRLSGGQQKRAAIAQAIVHVPRLLLLDEPTAALDPKERRAVLEAIRLLGESTTVLLSTHITADLDAATHVLVIDRGRARFTGTKSEFRERGDGSGGDEWEAAYSSVCEAA